MSSLADRYRDAGWWTGERLIDRFEQWVSRHPDRMAVTDGTEEVTLAELWSQGSELASELAGKGPQSEIVVVFMPNTTDWMRAFVAVLRAGAIPATIPITTTGDHLRHAVELVGAARLVTCPKWGSSATADLAVAAAGGRAEVITLAGGMVNGREGRPDPVSPPEGPADLAHVMFTSSTTGPPKAVMHSDDTLATLNRQFADRFELTDDSPLFMPSPLGHSVGAIHGARLAMWTGAPLILQPTWDPDEALSMVDRHRAEFTAAATPFLVDLLDADAPESGTKLESLRWFLCGGAQVPPAMVRRARVEFPDTYMTPLWGMTEGGLTTCLGAASTEEQQEATVGIGLPDLEVAVLDGSGRRHAVGSGELVMRGPGVFIGYLGQADLYRELLTDDGYFRTGDTAKIDDDGYVSITGRVKDLIIRGGVNISPVMTENVLASHPAIRAVAVVGWPDERLGERLCAVVISADPPTLDEVVAFCGREGLDRRFHPERLIVVDEFPRTAAGKIRKHELLSDLIASGV